MQISFANDGTSTLIAKVSGELDHHIAGRIRDEADARIVKDSIKKLIFDFSELNFMDSSGIGVIMGRYRQVIFKGGRIGVTGVKAGVERIFKLSGLYKIIERYESETEAFLRPVTEYYAGR